MCGFRRNIGYEKSLDGLLDKKWIESDYDHVGSLEDFLAINKEATVYYPASSKPPGVKKLVSVDEPIQIHEGVHSTGELKDVEQSLVVETQAGPVVIVGCSHPGVGTIPEASSRFGKIHAVAGGLHGFSEFGLLEDITLVCPTHCTRYKSRIESLYPEKCIDGGAGRVIEI